MLGHTIADVMSTIRDSRSQSNAVALYNHRTIMVYDAIITTDSIDSLGGLIASRVVSYDESHTYIAATFHISKFNINRLTIRTDDGIVIPKLKIIYNINWIRTIEFMNSWNKWNTIDNIRLTI